MQVQWKFTLFLPWCSHPRILCSHTLVQWNNTKQWKKRETTKVTSLICIAALKIIPYYQFHVKWVQNMMSHQTKCISFSLSLFFFFFWLERKGCFNQEARNMGRRQTHVSNQLWRFCLAMTVLGGFFDSFLREKGEEISVNQEGKRLDSASFSIVCRLPDSSQSFFRCYLAQLICLQDC